MDIKIYKNGYSSEDIIETLCDIVFKFNNFKSRVKFITVDISELGNYKFDLIVSDTLICKGAWIGAFSVLCPGITVGKYSVLTVSSVAKSSLDPNLIYAGNPAVFVRKRYDNEG